MKDLTKKWNAISSVKDQVKKIDLLFFENMIQSEGLEIFSEMRKNSFIYKKQKSSFGRSSVADRSTEKDQELVGSFFKPNIKLINVLMMTEMLLSSIFTRMNLTAMVNSCLCLKNKELNQTEL
jgi:hypothetical protein